MFSFSVSSFQANLLHEKLQLKFILEPRNYSCVKEGTSFFNHSASNCRVVESVLLNMSNIFLVLKNTPVCFIHIFRSYNRNVFEELRKTFSYGEGTIFFEFVSSYLYCRYMYAYLHHKCFCFSQCFNYCFHEVIDDCTYSGMV